MVVKIDTMCPDLRAGPCPTVLLRHELPDGSWHVDWMIARHASSESPLITFRLPERLDAVEPGRTLIAERIGDHRAAYLQYEGAVSGNRGHVTRLRSGAVVEAREADDARSTALTVRWGGEAGNAYSQSVRLIAEKPPEYLAKVL